MKVKKYGKRLGALMLSAAVFLSGCANDGPAKKEVTDAPVQMGRYIENFWDTNAELDRCSPLTRLADGSLAVFSYNYGPYISKDEGKTWEPWKTEWYGENSIGLGFNCAAIAPDGAMFVAYTDYRDEMETQAAGGEENGDVPDPESDDDTKAYSEDDFDEVFKQKSEYQLVDADGKVGRQLEIQIGNEYSRMKDCWFAPDGTLYAADYDKIYEVSLEDGSLTSVLEYEGNPGQVCFNGNDLIVTTTEGAFFVDRESRELKDQDAVLDGFLKEKGISGGSEMKYTSDSYNVYLYVAEDDVLLLVCEDGIYQHKIGGGTMEKLVEGSLSTLGDPTQGIYGMAPLKNDAFLVLYLNGMGLFTYDAQMPTVPEKELKVFSMEKDRLVQKAVSLFQQAHQDVYVNYEIGLSENSGQTAEDVIKNLNTEILAGNGPDVLILDGFPMDAYMEKGLLEDLSDVLEEAKAEMEIYDNIAGAYRQDDVLYAIPMNSFIPALLGPVEEIGSASGLEGLVNAVHSLRGKKESGSVMGGVTPYGVLKMLALSSAPAWENGDGGINTEALEEFLTAAKEIYGEEAKGVTELEKENFGNSVLARSSEKGIHDVEAWLMMDMQAGSTFLNDNRLAIGRVDGVWSLQTMFSVTRQRESMKVSELCGQKKHVFMPLTIAGVAASAREKELAKQFVKEMLSEEANGSGDGFSVNKKALEAEVAVNSNGDGGILGAMGMSDEEGNAKVMTIYQLTKEQVDWLYETMESLTVPYLPGSQLENAVYEAGEILLAGETDVPGAIAEIQNKVKLSMAE